MGAASSPNKASAVRFVLVAPYALKDVSIPLIYIESISSLYQANCWFSLCMLYINGNVIGTLLAMLYITVGNVVSSNGGRYFSYLYKYVYLMFCTR